jgi:molecular chaperone GrpE (heat shock protein)
VDIFGRDLHRAQSAAEQVARHAVAVAGGAVPQEGCSLEESLATIDTALSALAEARENSVREVQRLIAAGANQNQVAHVPPKSALLLAELRDRLRVLADEDKEGVQGTGSGTGTGTGTLRWVIARLDEVLEELEVREFADDGAVNVQRHQIVARRAADPAHPVGTIARSVLPGLTLAGALLRAQQVIVYADGDDGRDE